jgi:hypothetical protein
MAVKLIYQVKARLGGQLGLLSRARKLARRCHHTLRNLDDQVLAPANTSLDTRSRAA